MTWVSFSKKTPEPDKPLITACRAAKNCPFSVERFNNWQSDRERLLPKPSHWWDGFDDIYEARKEWEKIRPPVKIIRKRLDRGQ